MPAVWVNILINFLFLLESNVTELNLKPYPSLIYIKRIRSFEQVTSNKTASFKLNSIYNDICFYISKNAITFNID